MYACGLQAFVAATLDCNCTLDQLWIGAEGGGALCGGGGVGQWSGHSPPSPTPAPSLDCLLIILLLCVVLIQRQCFE